MFRKYMLRVVALIVALNSMEVLDAPAFAYPVQRATAQAYTSAGVRATASDYVVNNLDDIEAGSCTPAHCSLRDAIISANSDTGADTITFSVSGTITLTGSLPSISDTLTIDGSGKNITICGANAYQVMYVDSGATLILDALTIANGSSAFGGGLANQGVLTVTNSVFSGNSAMYGGGLVNWGVLAATNSTFSGNSATFGGGLINEPGATATITSSTIFSNRAIWECPCPGGGGGGGIFNSGTLALTNSTISGNWTERDGSAGGGVYNLGSLSITNSTFYGNASSFGGGVYNASTLTVRNTIIADGDCAGTVINDGNNIDSGGSCGWGSGNGSLSHVDPRLGLLADNGGATLAMRLLPDSPAIDAVTFNAPNACPAKDQRGVLRPIGPRCDIGAVESSLIVKRIYLPQVNQ